MYRLGFVAFTLAVLGLTGATASAQAPRGGGRGISQLTLLGQKSVQDELKLSEDQLKKVTELTEKAQAARKELQGLGRDEIRKKMEETTKANDKAVAEILKPEQTKRLKQVVWQQRGSGAISDPEVSAALQLSDDQKEKAKTIQEEASKERRAIFQNAGGNVEEARKKMDEQRKATQEKLTALLNDQQKTKWKELLGEPFKGELQFPQRRERPKQTDSKQEQGSEEQEADKDAGNKAKDSARGQRPGPMGFGGPGGSQLMLLSQKSVQDELKLSEDQVKKATELAEKARGSFRELRGLGEEEMRKKLEETTKANSKAVAEILKPEQTKRLKQIAWQLSSAGAFYDPEVVAALRLTDEQKEKAKAIQEEAGKQRREIFQNAGGNFEEARKKFEEQRKGTQEKLTNLLTDQQKSKWKELQGEPFKGELQFPRGPQRSGANGPRRSAAIQVVQAGKGPAAKPADPKAAKPADPKKAEELEKARAEVKKQEAALQKARSHLAELEGHPLPQGPWGFGHGQGWFSSHRPMFGPWSWFGRHGHHGHGGWGGRFAHHGHFNPWSSWAFGPQWGHHHGHHHAGHHHGHQHKGAGDFRKGSHGQPAGQADDRITELLRKFDKLQRDLDDLKAQLKK